MYSYTVFHYKQETSWRSAIFFDNYKEGLVGWHIYLSNGYKVVAFATTPEIARLKACNAITKLYGFKLEFDYD